MREYESAEVREPRTEAQNQASLGRFALLITFCATVLLVVGMVADKQKVTLAFSCGIGFFVFMVVIVVGLLSGQISEMWRTYLQESTIQQQNRMQYKLYLHEIPRKVLEEKTLPPLPEPLPETASLPLPQANFVSARPDTDAFIKAAAIDFIRQLFYNGQIDPTKVLGEDKKKPGQIQNMKKPKKEVVELLLALRIVWLDETTNMLFYNVKDYPTLRDCQQAVKYNVPK